MGIVKITLIFVVVVEVRSTWHSSIVKGGDHLQDSILSLHPVGPRGQTQAVRLDSKCCHLLSHLTGPAQNFHIPVGNVPVSRSHSLSRPFAHDCGSHGGRGGSCA